MDLFLGVDVGTSGCKVMAVDRQGRIVGQGTYAIPTRYPHPGWAEQEPADWYGAACAAIRACLANAGIDPGDITGVSVDGPAHNVALLDGQDAILYPTIHWSDLRSVPQSERLAATHDARIFQVTHQRVNPSWTLAQLLWLKENEPGVWARLRRVLVTKDYVRHRLTGDYLTDVYDAIGTQLYDMTLDAWSAELCELLDFPVDWLPTVAPVAAIAGQITAEAARDTGLLTGTPVAVGSGDSVVEAFGVGVVEPGQGIVKLGTAANVNLVTAEPKPSPTAITYRHVIDGRYFSILATNAGTLTMNWFRDTFARSEVAQAEAQGLSVYDLIGQLAAGAPVGCEGLLFHPYLMGERSPYWDPHLRGDFVGISVRHDRPHFARAMLEGVAFSVRDCLEAAAALGQSITELRLLGGGAKSLLWRQILCDVLGQPLLKPAVEDAAFGAALLAGVAVGGFPDWQSAVTACVQVGERLHPDPAAAALYETYFVVFRGVTRDLAKHSHRLAELATGELTVNVSITE